MTSGADDATLFHTLAIRPGKRSALLDLSIPRDGVPSILSPFLSKTNPNPLDCRAPQREHAHGREHHGPSLDNGGVVFDRLGLPSGDYRGLGGCGFGTPVVSYAPRPMVKAVMIENREEVSGRLGGIVSDGLQREREKEKKRQRFFEGGTLLYSKWQYRMKSRSDSTSQIDYLGCVKAEMTDVDGRCSEVVQMQVRSDDRDKVGTWKFLRIAVVSPGEEGG